MPSAVHHNNAPAVAAEAERLADELAVAFEEAYAEVGPPPAGSYESQKRRDARRRAQLWVPLARLILDAEARGERDPRRLAAPFVRAAMLIAARHQRAGECFDALDESESLEECRFNAAQALYRRTRSASNAAALLAAWRRYYPTAERFVLSVDRLHFAGGGK